MGKQRKRTVLWIRLSDLKRWMIAACLLVLLVAVMTYEIPSTKTWTYWTLPLSGKVIVLDAGHGGPDGGAVSKQGIIEKDINLAITLYLRDYLQQSGAIVRMTREGDYDLAGKDTKILRRRKTEDLMKRMEMIEKQKPDLMVSIHLNSFTSARWRGAQTFYYPSHPDNGNLAGLIQEEIKRNLENTERVAKAVDRDVYLLKMTKAPSALVEVGFLSHPEESRLLADEDYQRQVAASIYKGILRYSAGEKMPTSK